MRVLVDDREYEGSPESIVWQMWDDGFHRDTVRTVDDYVKFVAQNVFKFAGIGIDINAPTTEGKCQRLLDGLVAAGIVIDLEANTLLQ